MSRSSPGARLFVVGAVIVVVAVIALALGGHQARPAEPASQPPGYAESVGQTGEPAGGGSSAGGPSAPVQEDPEAVDPALRLEHDRLLEERPVFEHLPYRDTEIGVDFDRVVAGGRLELLVTYLGSRARAVRDLRRLLRRYDDPGTAYVERYERVF